MGGEKYVLVAKKIKIFFVSLQKDLETKVFISMGKKNIQENAVILENGEPRIVLSEETKSRGWVTIEEARRLIHESISQYCKTIGMK